MDAQHNDNVVPDETYAVVVESGAGNGVWVARMTPYKQHADKRAREIKDKHPGWRVSVYEELYRVGGDRDDAGQ